MGSRISYRNYDFHCYSFASENLLMENDENDDSSRSVYPDGTESTWFSGPLVYEPHPFSHEIHRFRPTFTEVHPFSA